MSEQGNIPIAEDLRYVYSEASVDPPRPARKWPLRARDNVIRHSIERISRAEAERDQFKADASWAATHRSELADLRDAFAKSEAEVAQLKADRDRLRNSLELVYDRWENGVHVHEVGEDGVVDEGGSSLGNALKLDFAEEQEILNLIVDEAEDFEEACANCNKPYRAHLLHDGNKCGPNGPAWFPGKIADALLTARTGRSNGV